MSSGQPAVGIDVSNWQGTVDWQRVRNAGIAFAYAKASEGNNFGNRSALVLNRVNHRY